MVIDLTVTIAAVGSLVIFANAMKPFFGSPGRGACGVKLPNNSVPSSMVPLPLRSSASHASSEFAVVHPRLSAVPSPPNRN